MGIKGLGTFLSTKHKHVLKPFFLRPEHRLAIDLTLFIHRFYHTDSTTPTIESISDRVLAFYNGLRCLKKILVVDGGAFEDAKKHAHERRATAKESVQKRGDGLEERLKILKDEIASARACAFEDDVFDYHEYVRILIDESLKVELELETNRVRGTGLPKEMMRGIIHRLERFPGIEIVRAEEGEAEKHCAYLCRKGEADFVVTEDLDSLCFGAPFLVRGITSMTPTVICLDELLASMGFTMEKFVDFCILSGSDFTRNPKGFGPATAFKAIQASGDITRVDFKKWEKEEKEEFLKEAIVARKIFLTNCV